MYTTETYKQPFWAENSGFMTGRDPLGIQNSSITVYGRLLPGMTNLTQRLRYYGFYCWLLTEFDSMSGNEKERTLTEQYNFIRRAELIIAYLMVNLYHEELSIIGNLYATKNKEQIKDLGFYDIAKGSDKYKDTVKGSVYWDYPSGALGQYFVGSLIGLNLVEIRSKFFIITDKGKKLSNAFKESVDLNSRKLLLEVIEKGRVNINEINGLSAFAINNIPPNSEEWSFYKKLLLSEDGLKTTDGLISNKRRESIKLYLEYADHGPDDLDFPQYQFYLFDQNGYINDANLGWYYYYINEVFHYAIETIFWAILVELDGKIIGVYDFISTIGELMLEYFSSSHSFDKNKTIKEVVESNQNIDLIEELKALEQLTKSECNHKEAIGKAVEIIFQTFSKTSNNLKEIEKFENLNEINFQKGRILEHIDVFITKWQDKSLEEYFPNIVKHIINDHISTAYRKMGNGESNLLKFIIEDTMIGHIQTMIPKHTTPRIRTLENFMSDMGFIDKNKELTEEGEQILIELNN